MMNGNPNANVALLIDFENLVRGVRDSDSVDCDVLFRLAEEYGRVLVANAYADWRMKDVNQYQTELYRRGAELVHVLGKWGGGGNKNAVDVKMAVDAISTMSHYPHIDVFVIVSGDRDFIHVLRALRCQGKSVVGVSPRAAASEDFAALCDRFVEYDSLAAAYEAPTGAEAQAQPDEERADLAAVRQALATIIEGRDDGIKGAMIKPLLRRELSATFDESKYGFSRMSDLLHKMDDVVKVVHPHDGGDMIVYPLTSDRADRPVPATSRDTEWLRLIRTAGLVFYRYERDPERRRLILARIHEAMAAQTPFTWEDVEQHVLDELADAPMPLSVTVLARYRTIIYHSRGFVFEPDQQDRPHRERLLRLREDIDSTDALIRLYEGSIAYKINAAVDDNLGAETLANVLGLNPEDESALEYCRELIEVHVHGAYHGDDEGDADSA